MKLDRYKTHDIEIVIDRLKIDFRKMITINDLLKPLLPPCIMVTMC